MQYVTVTNRTRNTIIGEGVGIANTSFTRMRGLLGRAGLHAGEGLWIKPSSGVHTLGMRFAIDVVGLDKERRVVRLWSGLVPYRVTSVSFKVASVIEFASGTIVACSIELGDQIEFTEPSAA